MPNSPPKALPSLTALPRTIPITRPLQWLARGWQDMARCGGVSYAHGLAMAAFGALVLLLASERFWLMAGAFSGFLLVAPILATSLYALSRALEQGRPASFAVVSKTWLNWHDQRFNRWGEGHRKLLKFGLLLALAGTGWVLTSAALITLLAPLPVTTPVEFMQQVVLARSGYLFELWLVLGGVLAAPIFASTVVTVPLLLDRQISLKEALLTSWLVILANPLPMACWGALILSLTLLGFGTALLGLVLVVPLLGHASWHAYRELLDVTGLPEREQR